MQSCILNKILDWIILLKEHKSLSSSPLQFDFKKGLSTTQCTHSLLEIVDYYNYNKSDVFILVLDASKAFDRVRYCKLFNELLDRDIFPVVLRILIYIIYMNQILRVPWCHTLTSSFKYVMVSSKISFWSSFIIFRADFGHIFSRLKNVLFHKYC